MVTGISPLAQAKKGVKRTIFPHGDLEVNSQKSGNRPRFLFGQKTYLHEDYPSEWIFRENTGFAYMRVVQGRRKGKKARDLQEALTEAGSSLTEDE